MLSEGAVTSKLVSPCMTTGDVNQWQKMSMTSAFGNECVLNPELQNKSETQICTQETHCSMLSGANTEGWAEIVTASRSEGKLNMMGWQRRPQPAPVLALELEWYFSCSDLTAAMGPGFCVPSSVSHENAVCPFRGSITWGQGGSLWLGQL